VEIGKKGKELLGFLGNPTCDKEPMCGNAAEFAAENGSKGFGGRLRFMGPLRTCGLC
jgi:hypothetical protein